MCASLTILLTRFTHPAICGQSSEHTAHLYGSDVRKIRPIPKKATFSHYNVGITVRTLSSLRRRLHGISPPNNPMRVQREKRFDSFKF